MVPLKETSGGYGVVMEWVGNPYKKSFMKVFVELHNRMELLAVIVGLEN
jgi:ribonuclease HI